MPTLTKRTLARRVRELLNHNGLHWMQGDYMGYKYLEEKDDEIQAFCLMGGIQEVLLGDGHTRPGSLDPNYPLWAETVRDLADIIRRRSFSFASKYPVIQPRDSEASVQMDENCVISFNDADGTTWTDIHAILSELALVKAQKATPPEARGPNYPTL